MSLEEGNSELINCSNNTMVSSDCDKENKNFRFSQILFTDLSNDSMSLKFVMRPCPQRRHIRQLIEFGGGLMTRLTDCDANKAINLVPVNANINDYNISNNNYYYCNYIYDCCEANQLLDFDKYKLKKTTIITKSSDSEDNQHNQVINYSNEDNDKDNGVNEWRFDERDFKILCYIGQRKAFADISGNKLWVRAFDAGVTFGLTWQSTKDRFFNYIMPNIDNYSIDDLHKEKFRKYHKISKNNSNNNGDDNNESIETQKCKPNSIEKISIPDIVVTAATPVHESEESDEQFNAKATKTHITQSENNNKDEVVDKNDANQSSSPKKIDENSEDDSSDRIDDISVVVQTNPTSSSEINPKQMETTSRKSLKSLNCDPHETTSDSDLDFGDDNATISPYFSDKKSKQVQNKPSVPSKKEYLNAYLEFIERREETSTPENLQRIKQALKVSKTNNSGSSSTQTSEVNTSTQTKNNITFGAKVLQKLNEKQLKKADQVNSEDKGYRVSDISSDDSDNDDISVLSEKVPKTKLFSHRNRITPSRHKQTALYDLNEDEIIIKYILKTKRFDELKGNSVWEEAEKKDICNGRTWQSMKQRFKKHIMPNIDNYDFTKKEKTTLKRYFFTERESEANRSTTGAYTDEEDQNILQFIIDKNGYDLVKGNKFWRDMEEDMIQSQSSNRSWQSLKERYRKRIIPNLNKYRIKIEFVKKMLNSISWISSDDKKILINKCSKALTNAKQTNPAICDRPKKRPLPIQKDSINNNYDSDTELEDQAEQQQNKEKIENKSSKKIKL